jgi:uncharacterized protein with PQ loop repeat
MNKLEKITTLMGLTGQCATYIQAYKIFYLKSAYAISFTATFVMMASMVFWLIYGMEKRSKPLIICNTFGIIGAGLTMAGILYYGCSFF